MKAETIIEGLAPTALAAALWRLWPLDGIERARIEEKDYDRRAFIGSSNVAAIMKLSPTIGGETYTPYEVFLAKTSKDVREEMQPQLKLFLERRKRLEPYAFQMLDEEFQAELFATNNRYIDPVLPYLCSEIDAESVVDGEVTNIEVKSVSSRAFSEKFGWGSPGTNEVPIHYYLQVQHGLMVTGRRRAFVAALVGFDQMEFYPIERSEDDIAAIRFACQKFWTENVLANVPPEAQTLSDLSKMYRTPNRATVEATPEVGSQALRLRAIWSQMKAMEFEAEALEFDVKNFMKDAEELTVSGDRLCKWGPRKFAYLDQQGLKEKEPKLHKLYMISGTRRNFETLAGWKPSGS